jgi:hypothetical protein
MWVNKEMNDIAILSLLFSELSTSWLLPVVLLVFSSNIFATLKVEIGDTDDARGISVRNGSKRFPD